MSKTNNTLIKKRLIKRVDYLQLPETLRHNKSIEWTVENEDGSFNRYIAEKQLFVDKRITITREEYDTLLSTNDLQHDIEYTVLEPDEKSYSRYIGEIPLATGGGGEVDLNEMAYFDYAGRFYGDKYSLLANAWESSLTVDTSEISADGALFTYRGKAQYPNGETEGVIIPQGVTTIGNNSFGFWPLNNQPLVIPNSVTSIGNSAFSGWNSNNQPLVIPDSVTSIGTNVFSSWEANTHPLVIPDSVTSIRNGAFSFWWSVPYVEIQAITPPTLSNINAFNGQNNAPIYVPDASVTAYKTATNWVDLADRIFPISDKPISYDVDEYFNKTEINSMLDDKVEISDIVNNLASTDTNKPLSANQGKVLNDTTAKLAVSNVFTQPQIVPNAENDDEAVNLGQLNTVVSIWRYE